MRLLDVIEDIKLNEAPTGTRANPAVTKEVIAGDTAHWKKTWHVDKPTKKGALEKAIKLIAKWETIFQKEASASGIKRIKYAATHGYPGQTEKEVEHKIDTNLKAKEKRKNVAYDKANDSLNRMTSIDTVEIDGTTKEWYMVDTNTTIVKKYNRIFAEGGGTSFKTLPIQITPQAATMIQTQLDKQEANEKRLNTFFEVIADILYDNESPIKSLEDFLKYSIKSIETDVIIPRFTNKAGEVDTDSVSTTTSQFELYQSPEIEILEDGYLRVHKATTEEYVRFKYFTEMVEQSDKTFKYFHTKDRKPTELEKQLTIHSAKNLLQIAGDLLNLSGGEFDMKDYDSKAITSGETEASEAIIKNHLLKVFMGKRELQHKLTISKEKKVKEEIEVAQKAALSMKDTITAKRYKELEAEVNATPVTKAEKAAANVAKSAAARKKYEEEQEKNKTGSTVSTTKNNDVDELVSKYKSVIDKAITAHYDTVQEKTKSYHTQIKDIKNGKRLGEIKAAFEKEPTKSKLKSQKKTITGFIDSNTYAQTKEAVNALQKPHYITIANQLSKGKKITDKVVMTNLDKIIGPLVKQKMAKNYLPVNKAILAHIEKTATDNNIVLESVHLRLSDII